MEVRECSEFVMGVDEAGRGPVIGPMVVAGVAVCRERLAELQSIGVGDSKALSRRRREALLGLIEGLASLILRVIVPPRLIDEENLNVIERNSIAFIVGRGVDILGDRLVEVYIDAVGDPRRIERVVRSTGFAGRVVVEPKADAKYVIVGAASIVAKVERDSAIEELRRVYGVRGSGYPTDPETIEWIREEYERNPDNPPWFVRRTWGNLRRIAPRWYQRKRVSSSRQRSLLDYL